MALLCRFLATLAFALAFQPGAQAHVHGHGLPRDPTLATDGTHCGNAGPTRPAGQPAHGGCMLSCCQHCDATAFPVPRAARPNTYLTLEPPRAEPLRAGLTHAPPLRPPIA